MKLDPKLAAKIDKALNRGELLESSASNIGTLLGNSSSGLYSSAVAELVEMEKWSELNDRFFKTLAFGTGGLRGRTIGKIVTAVERGSAAPNEPPEFPCVGTNAMNFFNINRATQGLARYLCDWKMQRGIGCQPMDHRQAADATTKPKLVIAYDTRFFSREFAELAARVAVAGGCEAFLFAAPRSTPELSFAVRHLRADAGIVVTASHNPSHDNGYKVYFNDGAQVIEPHASGIIQQVNAVAREIETSSEHKFHVIGEEIDRKYMERLETLILDRELIRQAGSLRIVFTPIHGTGGVIIKPMLERLGFNFAVVDEQDQFDGAFPTVKSPNPENAEALQMGIELAKMRNGDLVIATDPDCDRMGVAVRARFVGKAGMEMKLLTGNQIGSLIAYYRIKKLFELGILDKSNAGHGVIIKTFVTTDLQKAIAEHFGLRCVETLTGFKYIGAKLGKYQDAVESALGRDPALRGPDGVARRHYQEMSEEQTRKLRLEHSMFYVFGGEESYGYSGADFVRDKDGNGAVVMFCETAAYASSRGQTLDELLDEIFCEFGYFEEKNGSLVFEGAEGAAKIQNLVKSYTTRPPGKMLDSRVTSIRNFEKEIIYDVEGDEVPKEKMSIFELEDKTRIAVRPSGTEPKIKYYLFAQRRPQNGKFKAEELATIKAEVGERLTRLWEWLQADAQSRLAG